MRAWACLGWASVDLIAWALEIQAPFVRRGKDATVEIQLERRLTLSASDKMEAAMDKAKGKIKEGVGKVTNDDGLIVEGKADQITGDVKQAAEKAKDAAKDAFDR